MSIVLLLAEKEDTLDGVMRSKPKRIALEMRHKKEGQRVDEHG